MNDPEIYSPAYVKALFDEMTATYGLVNVVSSFGFCHFWRKACIRHIPWRKRMVVYDWMTGMGELWEHVLPRIGPDGRLVALDISTAMCDRARARKMDAVEILEIDVLENGFSDASADCVLSSFGIKTFSDTQKARLAKEIHRVLKPGGVFSLIEISVPASAILRVPYMFYVKRVIPALGRLFLGNPENYRMLGVYTERFGNCDIMAAALKNAGLEVSVSRHFAGCATSVFGRKPE
jgi:demethylmenaquinone methyltransferase/2-methoxy-6-polyprenyl-1,4-benzoquinol methylase